MTRFALLLLFLGVGSLALAAQTPPDTVHRIAALHAVIVGDGAQLGPRIWPGFRPDTISTLYVIPHRAKLFAQWRDTAPSGFFPLSATALGAPSSHLLWTDTRRVSFPRGRPIAFLSVDSTAPEGSVLGLALHEAFHAFQQASARAGRRFGAGENSLLVSTYPAFDVENEAAFALEGTLLHRALRARNRDDTRRATRDFLAVRERRHAALDSELVAFETAAELHEGLAQYALIRGIQELAHLHPARFAGAARRDAANEAALLDSMLVIGPRSIRRRFYATGSAIALLLDRIAARDWKERLMREDATLEQMLVEASGFRGRAALAPHALARLDRLLAAFQRQAESATDALARRRDGQRDSLLAGGGLRIALDPSELPRRRLDWCFFDPQNVLPTRGGELMHMRMVRVCAGERVEAEFNRGAVEHRASGVFTAYGGDSAAIRLTAAGSVVPLPADGTSIDVTDLRIESPTMTLSARRALLARQGTVVRVTPRS